MPLSMLSRHRSAPPSRVTQYAVQSVRPRRLTLIMGLIACASASDVVAADPPPVRFDVAAVVPAVPVAAEPSLALLGAETVAGDAKGASESQAASDVEKASNASAVRLNPLRPAALSTRAGEDLRLAIPLELSTLVTDPLAPRIDQMVIEVALEDPELFVEDYRPRTQLASPYAGEIQIEQTQEASSHIGLNATGSYPPFGHADIGGDRGSKQIESRKFQRVAPLEILAASGTTHRGRGVFFKLRATATQVLEGDKALQIVVRAPAGWRGGLLRVQATAQTVRRSLPGMPRETHLVGRQQFLVAAYLAGDLEARQMAMRVIDAERLLRAAAVEHQGAIEQRSAPTVFHQMAARLDLTEPRIASDWLQRVIFGAADPHRDVQLRRLPVDVRVAVLDFQDARATFVSGLEPVAGEHLVATEATPPRGSSQP